MPKIVNEIYNCPNCLCDFKPYAQQRFRIKHNKVDSTYCSRKCYFEMKSYKFGPYVENIGKPYKSSSGYIMIRINGRRVGYHRYLMQKHLNRNLMEFEEVHHINGVPNDNRIENLVVLTTSQHMRLHKTKNKIKINCYCCGNIFYVIPSRKKAKYCSNKCRHHT